MLNRRKALCIASKFLKNKSIFNIESLFLYLFENEKNPFYSFYPSLSGPYSTEIEKDLNAMEKEGYFTFDNFAFIPNEEKIEENKLDEDSTKTIQNSANIINSLEKAEIEEKNLSYSPFLSMTYVINTLGPTSPFFKDCKVERDRIDKKEIGLYTIGYQGSSIDTILSALVENNIKTVVDIRRTENSFIIEFNSSNLSSSLKNAGINYVSLKNIGIDKELRKKYLENGQKKELFEYYKNFELPEKKEEEEKIIDILKTGSVSLICSEKDPKDCHRSILASYLENHYPNIHYLGDIKTQS